MRVAWAIDTYAVGVDRGVLYFDDTGSAWNGLTSVAEDFSESSIEPVYFDGTKIRDLQSVGDYKASLSAFTYPEEVETKDSLGLSYRTSNQIHIVYNLTATDDERSYLSIEDESDLQEISWNLSAVPVHVVGYRPTAHYIFNRDRMNPDALEAIEDILYGTPSTNPHLPPVDELIDLISEWALITIIDNGDGTWRAIGPDDRVVMTSATSFEIIDVDGSYSDAVTYTIRSTYV